MSNQIAITILCSLMIQVFFLSKKFIKKMEMGDIISTVTI